jgi:ribosomal protein S18 acetylase RimI-like enzyme
MLSFKLHGVRTGARVNFTIRPFRKSDKPLVLDISRRTWGGHDHLLPVFNKMVADPGCRLQVVEYHKKIIAFGIVRIIENDRTGWMEGLRVHPHYKRRGLAVAITKYNSNLAASFGVKRLRLLMEVENNISQKLPRKIGMSKRLTMNYLWKENIANPV